MVYTQSEKEIAPNRIEDLKCEYEQIRNNFFNYTGLIYQDKFSLILLPFLYVAFKRHFVNNHDKHSWVFDTQY